MCSGWKKVKEEEEERETKMAEEKEEERRDLYNNEGFLPKFRDLPDCPYLQVIVFSLGKVPPELGCAWRIKISKQSHLLLLIKDLFNNSP